MQFYGLDIPPASAAVKAAHLAVVHEILKFLRPVGCPFPLVRIGGDRDGAYLVPDDLVGIEACFSPGVNNFKNFEDDLLARYHLASHMCDFSSDADRLRTPLVKERQTFRKAWLDVAGAADAVTLRDWVTELAPNGDLLLQMDIEGAEYRNILHADRDTLQRFRIIVMELHALFRVNDPAVAAAVLQPFFARLAQDFACVHAHPNNCSPQEAITGTATRIPRVLEITLLRHDRFGGGTLIPPQLPHPLDIPYNVRTNQPEFLDDSWLQGPRSEGSQARIWADEVVWFREAADAAQARQIAVGRELRWLLPVIAKAAPPVPSFPDRPLRDLAAGRSFSVNEPYGRFPARGHVRNCNPFFFSTALRVGPRITVDLEDSVLIREIVITNRTDACFNRAEIVIAIAHTEADPESGLGFIIPTDENFLLGKILTSAVTVPYVLARFVTFTSPLYTALHFSDLAIQGTSP